MADLSIYELEDIIWDEFEHGDDHIVPHRTDDKREGDSCKNLNNSSNVCQLKKDKESKTLDNHIPDGVFTASGDADSAKDAFSVQSRSGLCADEGILNDTSGAVDKNSYNDLLYSGWPDIGNLEDVNRMLSNCDSSFGLGNDELAWLTSEDPGGGYEQPLNTDFKFPCSELSAYVNPGGSNRSMESSCQPLFTRNHNRSGMMVLASGTGPVPSQKHFQTLQNKITCKSDMTRVKAKKGASEESDLLDVLEGSSISFELDEISPEVTTFRQLQQVMLQLDLRTKLCIRDSLYRLAKSAEQQHNNGCISDSKYTGIMDMENHTNPIDRIIAHLLFHRPMVGPLTVTEKPSCQQTEHEPDEKGFEVLEKTNVKSYQSLL